MKLYIYYMYMSKWLFLDCNIFIYLFMRTIIRKENKTINIKLSHGAYIVYIIQTNLVHRHPIKKYE